MAILRNFHSRSARLFPAGMWRSDAGAFFARSALLLFLSLGLTLAISTTALAQREAEINKLKAAFIYQFANFVEWPEDTFESDNEPFVICIVGNDEIREVLRAAVRGKSVGNHPVRVQTSGGSGDLSNCQIAFIDESERRNTPDLIDRYMDQPILTVGDSEDFTKIGGIIHLYPQASKLRIEINVDAAKRAGLKISSKLLRLATVVHDDRS